MTQPYVLLTESDIEYASWLQAALSEAGIHVRTAKSPVLARKVALDDPPVALLLDLDHQARDAVRLLGDLHRAGITSPVLWMSATVNAAGIDRVMNAGSQGLLSKGTDAVTAVNAVRAILAGETFFLENQPQTQTSGVRPIGDSERIMKMLMG